jgi:hypothetical protein
MSCRNSPVHVGRPGEIYSCGCGASWCWTETVPGGLGHWNYESDVYAEIQVPDADLVGSTPDFAAEIRERQRAHGESIAEVFRLAAEPIPESEWKATGAGMLEALNRLAAEPYRLTRQVFTPEDDIVRLVVEQLDNVIGSPSISLHEADEVRATARRIISLVRNHDPRGPQA